MNRCALVTVVMRRVSAGSLFGASLFSLLGSALHFLFLRGTIELCYISFREMTLKVEARLDWPIDSFDLISLVIINSYFKNIL